MTEKPVQRRLAAILAADVVGFSRLMAANEEGTLSALRQLRRELLDPLMAKYDGRIFKVMGDGYLVEFASVLNAARCAIDIQRGMPLRNGGLPEDRHVRFRIGINLGDIIVDDDDIYGDGVNIASRLEGIAPSGGIACSATVRAHIGNKIDAVFCHQGPQAVKNIDQPLDVYFIDAADTFPGATGSVREAQRRDVRAERPTIAVLPFTNMTQNADQQFFADGITEDIITDLSKVSGLSVISRNSVYALKDQATNLLETARRLGASYLVEGSVRRSGNRLRITAQLIEGTTDTHVWAERFDRELTDVFVIQDEITGTIVDQLRIHLLPEEREAIGHKPTRNIDAYSEYLKGMQAFRMRTYRSLQAALEHFDKAIRLDPRYADAYVGIAYCESCLKSFHGKDISVDRILAATSEALSINPHLAEAHVARGITFAVVDDRARANEAFERALHIDPNNFEAHYHYGRYFAAIGDAESAAQHYLRAMELQPDDFEAPSFLAQVLETLGRIDEARRFAWISIRRAEQCLAQNPGNTRAAMLMAYSLVYLGEPQRAREWLARSSDIDPDDNHLRYNMACAYALLGDFEKALDLLEIWIHHVAREGKLWFANDPDFAGLRDHPRYTALLKLVHSSGE